MTSTITNGCAVCQTPTTRYCSACKMVKYCNTDHQRQHWSKHKKQCRPFRIENDEILGRHLVATRDIQINSVIFIKDPLVIGPKWYVPENEVADTQPILPCMICNRPCRVPDSCCPRCQWPICSAECLMDTQKHSIECEILAKGPGPRQQNIKSLYDYYRPDALFVLRCLLLQITNPDKWKTLMNMQSHEEERQGTELHRIAENRIVKYLESNYLKHLKQKKKKKTLLSLENDLHEYDAKMIHRICGIIETNYMCINTSFGIELSGIFYTACMMEHSCLPNCYFSFDEQKNFRISIIAGQNIHKGDHLKIMYTNMLWSTQMRNEHLLMTKHFTCKCLRCCDPTELDTYLSALKCSNNGENSCDGIQLPKEPLNHNTDFECNKCGISLNSSQVNYMLTQMNEEVELLMASKPTIKSIENLVEKFSKFLHSHHYNMFNLKHSLIQLYDKVIPLDQLNEEDLNKKLNLCNELWDICNKLDPNLIRLSIYAAVILYEQHTVYIMKSRRLRDSQKDTEEYKNYISLTREALEKASQLLKKELDNIAVKQLYQCVQDTINNLDKGSEKSDI